MNEMLRHIFGSLNTQVKYNRVFTIFVVVATVNMVISRIELEKKIEDLRKDVERLQYAEGV